MDPTRPPQAGSATAWPGRVVGRGLQVGSSLTPSGALWPVVVLLLVAIAVSVTGAHHPKLGTAAVPLACFATGPLILVRRWPGVALGVVLAANAVFVMVARTSWSAGAVICWLIAIALCPLMFTARRSVTLLLAAELAVAIAAFVPRSVSSTPWDATIAEALAVLLAWGFGEQVRGRRAARDEQRQVEAVVIGLREREAASQGRAAIARELHDVVAHHVSLIAVRAATAPYQVAGLSPEAGEVLDAIAEDARNALDELRAVLGVLRSPEGAGSQAPQPGLSDLDGLIERLRSSGMRIDYDLIGPGESLPDSIGLCGYRIVQEGLTNAGRHAPGAATRVEVAVSDTDVRVSVVDDGAADGSVSAPYAPGFGLVGMRERVAALGGEFDAHPQGTGFAIEARIPRSTPARALS